MLPKILFLRSYDKLQENRKEMTFHDNNKIWVWICNIQDEISQVNLFFSDKVVDSSRQTRVHFISFNSYEVINIVIVPSRMLVSPRIVITIAISLQIISLQRPAN
jgi:hypothetical protein